MCGIAGIIHGGGAADVGSEMTSMLQSMKHRGPDSSGFAIYGVPRPGELVMRFKVAEQEGLAKGFDIQRQMRERRAEVDERIESLGGEIVGAEQATEYALRYRLKFDGDLRKFADYLEDIEEVEVLSLERHPRVEHPTLLPRWQYELGGQVGRQRDHLAPIFVFLQFSPEVFKGVRHEASEVAVGGHRFLAEKRIGLVLPE